MQGFYVIIVKVCNLFHTCIVLVVNKKVIGRAHIMKKRISAILIAALMLLALAACTGTETDELTERRRGSETNGSGLLQTLNSSVTLASDYDEIYAMIMELNARNNERASRLYTDSFIMAEAEEDSAESMPALNSAPADSAAAMGGGGADMDGGANYVSTEAGIGGENSDDFSDTNNQVDGVQESDIVKTDGRNIYIASRTDNSVNVIAVNNGSMELLAKIRNGGSNASISEMLLYDGKLITIWNNWEQIELEAAELDEAQGRYVMSDSYWGWGRWYWDYETIVEVYDTSGDFNAPVSSYSQKGWYNSSRMLGSNIYIISNFNPPSHMEFARADLHLYIPSFTVNGDEPCLVPASMIALPEKLEWVEYTVIGGLDVSRADMSVSISANLGGTHMIYASLDNIYLTRTEYVYDDDDVDDWGWWRGNGQNFTVINKFSISGGNVNFVASGKVKGNVGTQFYMDEHSGIFRIVTEVWGEVEAAEDNWWWGWGPHGASLYTMDGNLNVLDEVHEIGFGENVQSVRFDGDIGYIVTFFMVDPLFSFDLSDPHNIVQLDELKIPGFSRYMHRWADGLLLGIGVDADEEDGMRTGLKLSMFDTSDNENLSERHVYIIEMETNNQDWWSDDWAWSWFWTEAEWNHKAILICTEKNIIGFPYTYSFSSRNHWYSEYNYAVFSYDPDNGFTLINEIAYGTSDNESWWYSGGFQRGLYIGDYLYVIAEDRIVSAHLSNAAVIQELRFFDYEAWYKELQAKWEAEWAEWEEWDWSWDDDDWDEDDYWDEDDWNEIEWGEIVPMPMPEIEPLPAIEPRG